MPRTLTIEKTVYTYDELSQEAKERAMSWFAQGVFEFGWYESIYEDASNIHLKITSFDEYNLEAEFTKTARDTALACIEDHGNTCDTYADSAAFIKECDAKEAELSSKIAELEKLALDDWQDDAGDLEDAFNDWLADAEEQYLYAMRENYRIILRKEAEYMQSAEYLEGGICANEYEFDIDGNIA